jgi:chorismate synthase|tara:strand:+ start:698 stop:1789 length:1092 start_codon:yes stop_codon:yes gene_type:complete
MSGNNFGNLFRVTTFGESHGTAVGVVVDGCPSGLKIENYEIQSELNKRRPGQTTVSTTRKEADRIEVISGIFEGKSTGAPITMIVHNMDVDSSPYVELMHKPRPNHADLTYAMKYGHFDWRGGGRASGRETIGRVAAGAIAKKLLSNIEIEIVGHVIEVHGIRAKSTGIDDIKKNVDKNPIKCADLKIATIMEKEILKAKKNGDSVGGIVEILALNVPPGLGEPVFDKLDGDLAKAIMSIGAVKGVEIGTGFESTKKFGSENNDAIILKRGKIWTSTNNSGGLLGGISNGMPIIIRAAVKPTSSISKKQKTIDLENMKDATISIKGRHDPCIAPRVLPVCEAMVAITLADHAIRSGQINASKL